MSRKPHAMKSRFTRLAATVLVSLAAGLSLAPAAVRADEALYQAFGGEEGMQRIADDFITNVFADPRTAPYFAKASVKRLRVQLASHFCASVGGPCDYKGSSMKNIHGPLHIDRAAFNAVVEDLQNAMDKNNIPFRAQNKLLAALAPLHRDIESPRDAPSSPSLGLPPPDDSPAADPPTPVDPPTAAP